MPLYEYECTQCGRVTEVLQKINERPKRKCESCSGKLKKLISRTSFHLKGGGWFDQGYGDKASAKSSEGSDSSKTSASESKSDKAGAKSDKAGAESDKASSKSDKASSKSGASG